MRRPGDPIDWDLRQISRRRLLRLGAAAAGVGYVGSRAGWKAAAASLVGYSPGTTATDPGGKTVASSAHRVLYRGANLADGRSSVLQTRRSVLTDGARIAWIRPTDAEEDPGPSQGLEIVDARALTIVPGLVDAHCHLTSPGGANWLDHFRDSPSTMLATAERNGELAREAGTAWLREIGSPTVVDPVDGRRRALALGIRDRWVGRADRPRVRSGGTWIAPPNVMDKGVAIVVRNADELVAACLRQLQQGADLVKLYVQSANSNDSPWTAAEIRRAVDAVHARGAIVTAHTMRLGPATAAVLGGVDAIEHGFRLDADVCAEMARRGTRLVTTLIVPKSWLRIGQTSGGYWATRAGRRVARQLLERGEESARLARRAGVKICTGTDFGGGGSRAGQLAWEVESLVATGMQPWQALGAATWRGGELLQEPNAGRIKEGGPADFFLVDGDPYNDPGALWNVQRLA
ncbi:MAG: amidohydrolase family protein [Chloroflexota bacterium]